LRHKLDEAGIEGPQVKERPRPDRLEEPLGGAGAGLRSSVPAVEQASGNHAEVVLVAVRTVVAPREGAHLPRPKDGADGFGAVLTAPVLLHGFLCVF